MYGNSVEDVCSQSMGALSTGVNSISVTKKIKKVSCKYNAFTVYITVHLSWRGMELMRTGTSM